MDDLTVDELGSRGCEEAGGAGQGTEEAVDPQQMRQPLGVGQGQGLVAAVAELGRLLICVGG